MNHLNCSTGKHDDRHVRSGTVLALTEALRPTPPSPPPPSQPSSRPSFVPSIPSLIPPSPPSSSPATGRFPKALGNKGLLKQARQANSVINKKRVMQAWHSVCGCLDQLQGRPSDPSGRYLCPRRATWSNASCFPTACRDLRITRRHKYADNERLCYNRVNKMASLRSVKTAQQS